MSEIKETTDKTLRGDVRKPLSLKRTVESGHVRQSFSHGRSKSVVVEKKKKRTISAPGAEAEEPGQRQDVLLAGAKLDVVQLQLLEHPPSLLASALHQARELSAHQRIGRVHHQLLTCLGIQQRHQPELRKLLLQRIGDHHGNQVVLPTHDPHGLLGIAHEEV